MDIVAPLESLAATLYNMRKQEDHEMDRHRIETEEERERRLQEEGLMHKQEEERRGGRYASERMRMGERGGGGSFEDRAGVPTSMGCYIGKEWWGAACVVAHVQSINEQQEVSFVQVHQGRMASRHAPKIGGW